jgi:hypothetical protein
VTAPVSLARKPFDRAPLAELLGAGAVANFSVPFGLSTDHLPVLQFLVRDKAARGGRLKAGFLALDAYRRSGRLHPPPVPATARAAPCRQ